MARCYDISETAFPITENQLHTKVFNKHYLPKPRENHLRNYLKVVFSAIATYQKKSSQMPQLAGFEKFVILNVLIPTLLIDLREYFLVT